MFSYQILFNYDIASPWLRVRPGGNVELQKFWSLKLKAAAKAECSTFCQVHVCHETRQARGHAMTSNDFMFNPSPLGDTRAFVVQLFPQKSPFASLKLRILSKSFSADHQSTQMHSKTLVSTSMHASRYVQKSLINPKIYHHLMLIYSSGIFSVKNFFFCSFKSRYMHINQNNSLFISNSTKKKIMEKEFKKINWMQLNTLR